MTLKIDKKLQKLNPVQEQLPFRKNKNLILLAVIYIAFISLGLPDGILGVAWPSMRFELALPLEFIGIITTLLLFMSAGSSIVSGFLLTRFGTGGLTFVSGLITSMAILGFAIAPNFIWIIIFTIPLGFGQGAVDSGLNLYVAKHYSARHMNWLHCFWGIGASAGPLIMTWSLSYKNYRLGCGIIFCIQLLLSLVVLSSILSGLWKLKSRDLSEQDEKYPLQKNAGLFHLSDQMLAIALFFLYSGIEFSIGIWLNSVLIESRHLSVTIAGIAVSTYYASIMVGRFLSGILVNRLGNIIMIRSGILLAILGIVSIWFSSHFIGVFIGTMAVGVGLSPIYPCLMHETPRRFTASVYQKLIGFQIGAACLGSSLVSAAMGVFLSKISLELLFPSIAALLIATYICNGILNFRSKTSSL